MNQYLKRLFIFSLIFYFCVTMYTRFVDSAYSDFWSRLFFSPPLDFLEGKDNVDVQVCTLSASQVAQFLRTNPDHCTRSSEDCFSQDYVVIRLKHDTTVFGDIKCYFSCFPFPLVSHVYLSGAAENYLNLIYPFPAVTENEDSKKCDILMRWNNYGG